MVFWGRTGVAIPIILLIHRHAMSRAAETEPVILRPDLPFPRNEPPARPRTPEQIEMSAHELTAIPGAIGGTIAA